MMKDQNQKLKAIRYSVALGLVPCLEVRMRYAYEGAATPSEITDLDVLSVRPAAQIGMQRVFFDCKTVAKMSAINRALWAQGARTLAGCSEAFVILLRPAPEAHRLAADAIGVRLFHEALFDDYASTTSSDYKIERTYLCDVAGWDAIRTIPDRNANLTKIVDFLLTEAPTQSRSTVALRSLMGAMRRVRGELDPSKPAHRALFAVAASQLLLTSADLVVRFHTAFEKSLSKAQFESSLRYFVWDGRDNYEVRRKLNDALQRSKGGDSIEPFDLPGWEQFIELFRAFLDAPLLVGTAALPCKELGFREVSIASPEIDMRLAKRLGANARVRQFIQFSAVFLVQALQLPREFADTLLDSAKAVNASGNSPTVVVPGRGV